MLMSQNFLGLVALSEHLLTTRRSTGSFNYGVLKISPHEKVHFRTVEG